MQFFSVILNEERSWSCRPEQREGLGFKAFRTTPDPSGDETAIRMTRQRQNQILRPFAPQNDSV